MTEQKQSKRNPVVVILVSALVALAIGFGAKKGIDLRAAQPAAEEAVHQTIDNAVDAVRGAGKK